MPEATKLDSWKEIAAYLHKDERTAMRWAKLGMPVHRLPAERRGRVFAYATEIDRWLGNQDLTALNHAGRPIEPVAFPKGEVNPVNEIEGQTLPDHVGPIGVNAQRLRVLALVLGSLVLAPWAGQYAWWYATAQPASFRIDGSKLVVLDSGGHELWNEELNFTVSDVWDLPGFVPKLDRFRFVDLDRDGNLELLIAIVPKNSPSVSGSLVCFDRRGNKLWQFTPGRTVRYGMDEYSPPFSLDAFRVITDGSGSTSVWVVSHQIPWFPTAITRLDEKGRTIGEHWHPGHIGPFAEATLEGRRVMLVGGTNNEHVTAALAVIDYENPTGWSPARKEQYRCANCSGAWPVAYIIFPRSEIAQVLDARQTVREIRAHANGSFEIMVVADADLGGNTPGQAYTFESNLLLLSAEIVESYVYAHNEMQKLGILNHPLDRKRESESIRSLLYWDGTRFSKYPYPSRHARPISDGRNSDAVPFP